MRAIFGGFFFASEGAPMSSLLEIVWHGRGGQGAKTAATVVAEAAVREGKYSQGFPEYGPERMGAPMRGFTRISDAPIRRHCAVTEPQVVVVLDPTLLDVIDVGDGWGADRTIVINSSDDPATLREKHQLKGGRLFTVDATRISLDELKRPIPNVPMIGALLRATGILNLGTVLEELKEKFGKKFADAVVKGNLRAIDRAYREVREE
jgi:pyruvate ferredoxin oxidoreductase gamma subunit